MKKALVVLSGGQDSTCCLAIAHIKGIYDEVHAITFDYSQRHIREVDAARNIGLLMGVTSHEVVYLGNDVLKGTSPLTNSLEPLEQYSNAAEMNDVIGDRVEKTFVPMRNSLFLTLAANRAVCLGASDIYTGVCQEDNANYPDCRAIFLRAQEIVINEALGRYDPDGLNTGNAIKIVAPLIHTQKFVAIQEAMSKGYYAMLAFTHTSYDGQYPPLGADHATILRAHGFSQAGVPDPLVVRAAMEGLMSWPETDNYSSMDPVFISELEAEISHLHGRLVKLGGSV